MNTVLRSFARLPSKSPIAMTSRSFEKNQAEIIVSALVTLTTANMDIVYKDMVTSSHQEVALQQILAHLDSIRKDMVILEKSEFANLRSENEKMKRELGHLKARLTPPSLLVWPLHWASTGYGSDKDYLPWSP
ncbi:hypothetical protein NHX12_010271 [Muraenolepis orangiensis]|uniref:Uncharacterized protein n=1 Tax=Muraenolepis orangiensis TaxID=630683 RepID=A0A9Q0DKU9_9TELE|nr:hypothetical protein NHX12_010271 [Muraenolepis orangiensis]